MDFLHRSFTKVSNNNFQENPFSRSSGQIDGQREGRTDMTKLTGAFRDYAKSALKSNKTHMARNHPCP